MALFLVLWLVGQSQKVKEAVAGHFRNPPGILDGSRSGLLPGNEGVNEEIQPKEDSPVSFEDEMAKLERSAERLQQIFGETDAFQSIRNQIQIRMTAEGLEIQLTEKAKKVLFEVGSAHPVQDTKEVLIQIAKEIGKISNRAVIAGHTDRRPYSDQRHYSNWELSSDRANGARRVLVENGMKPEQIARVVGFADTQLLNEKDPYADANRRITILVLPLNEGRKPSALVGGPSETLEAQRDVLNAMGQKIVHVGPNGSSAFLKLGCNQFVAGIIASVGEGLALAKKGGVDRQTAVDVFMGRRIAC